MASRAATSGNGENFDESSNGESSDDSQSESNQCLEDSKDDREAYPGKSRNLTPGGLKLSFHGALYQLSLLTLIACRALTKGVPSRLISEAKEFFGFDDAVIDFGNRVTVTQVKHSEKKKITIEDFCKNTKEDLSLAKLFDSYLRLKNGPKSRSEDGKPKTLRFVFFTNRPVELSEEFLEDTTIVEDEFLFRDLSAQTLRVKKGNPRSRIVDAIRYFSEEVAKQACDTEHIDLCTRFKDEILEAAGYLNENQLEFSRKKRQKLIKGCVEVKKAVDFRSNISLKAISLVKLSQEGDGRIREILSGQMNKIKRSSKRDRSLLDLENLLEVFNVFEGNAKHTLTDVMQTDIDEFLDTLVIKIRQPDTELLLEYAREEIVVGEKFAPKELFNALRLYMLDTFAHTQKCEWEPREIIEFLKKESDNLHRFIATGGTMAFESKYSEYHIPLLNLENENLGEFLCNKEDPYVAFISGPGVELRVHATIETLITKNEVERRDWIYVENNCPYVQYLSTFLEAESTHFVILNLMSESCLEEEGVDSVFPRDISMATILRKAVSQKKKLVVIFREGLKKDLSELIRESKIEMSTNWHQFIDTKLLTDEQLKEICSRVEPKTVFVCGKEHKISDLVEFHTSSFGLLARNLDFLDEALTKPGSAITRSGLPYDVYVVNGSDRGIAYYDPESLVSYIQTRVIAIRGAERDCLKDYFSKCFNQDDRIHFIGSRAADSAHARFRMVENLTKISDDKETLILVGNEEELQSLGVSEYIVCNFVFSNTEMAIARNPGNIKLPIPMGYKFSSKEVSTTLSRDVLMGESQFSIVSAPAGYGKSSLCLNMRWEWLHNTGIQIPVWLVNISLPRLFLEEDPVLESVFTKSATDIQWETWQVTCLMKDMEIEGSVVLLLDSFDEIKDKIQVDRINDWLRKVPKTVSVVVTTRPHAMDQIVLPENRNLDGYFKLEAYTSEQRQTYINEYVKAIIKESREARQVGPPSSYKYEQELTRQVCHKLDEMVDMRRIDLLGIPLESYLFCESLKSKIMKSVESGEDIDFKDVFGKPREFNTMKLYEVFIREKLKLFLTKHMELSLEAITRSFYRPYIISNLYTETIALFAYIQLLGKDESPGQILQTIKYSEEIIKGMNDTGLLHFEGDQAEEERMSFNFTHKTYEEYFSAIYIMQRLISNDSKSHIEDVIINNRFVLKHRLIFCFMAQLSMVGSSLVPNFKFSDKRHVVVFWKNICEDGDIMGFATSSLYRDCLGELTQEQRAVLKEFLTDQKWSKSSLISCIENEAISDTDYHEGATKNNDIPFRSSTHTPTKEGILELESIEDMVKNLLESKIPCKISDVKQLLTKVSLPVLVEVFEKTIEKVKEDMRYRYWDIDGGFSTMALLGNGFTKKMADYFIERISGDPQWRVGPALGAILSLMNANLDGEAKDAVYSVICWLMIYHKSVKTSSDARSDEATASRQSNMIQNLVRRSSASDLVDSLILLLNKKLGEATSEDILLNFPDTLRHLILILKSILWVAALVPHAVVPSQNYKEFKLIRETTISVNLNPGVVSDSIFVNIQARILLGLKKAEHKSRFLDSIDTEWLSFVNETWPPEETDEWLRFWKNAADKLTDEASSTGKRDNWSRCGGIQSVGYTGKFFNDKLADYLIKRSAYWEDNHKLAVQALGTICDSLTKCIKRDENVETAISAYNRCIKYHKFSKENLRKI